MKPKKRLVFLAYSLSGGGLESQIATLTNAFADEYPEAKLLLWNDEIGYTTKMPIINLEKKFGKDTLFSKVRKYLFIRNFIWENKIDILIDYRHRKKPWLEFFLSQFIFKTHVIYTIHSHKIENYGFKNDFLLKPIFKNHTIVCVSKGIETKIAHKYPFLKNIFTIHNLVEPHNKSTEGVSFDYEFILFVGRVESPEKQVDLLIKTYLKSALYQKDIHLVLVGFQSEKQPFSHLIDDLQLNNFIHFFPFQTQVDIFYKAALFTVLCSKYEGFGLTLLESLLNETPVISFDCPCGPSEIIQHDFNGLLVENQNFEKLEQAMSELFSNKQKLNLLKSNALKSVEKFNRKNILQQWELLINR